MKRLNSLLALSCCVTLCTALFGVACNGGHTHEWSSTTGKCLVCGIECTHDWSTENAGSYDHVCLVCKRKTNHNYSDYKCIYCHETTIFDHATLSDSYYAECSTKGAVESVSYDTYAYAVEHCARVDAGTIAVEKSAYAYLPYGYDVTQKYDILYLLHGTGENEGYWFGVGDYVGYYTERTLKVVNNMIASGEAKPCIIVTPNFYTYAPEGSGYEQYNDDVDASTNVDSECLWSKYFGYELKDLVKTVEAKYSTYAENDVSDDGLFASRAHRGFAGLSRGSMISYESIIRYCLDYIGYVGGFSACYTAAETIIADIHRTHADYPIYYWYTAGGTKDSSHYQNQHDVMQAVYAALSADGTIKAGEDYENGDNWIWIDKLELGHSYDSWVGDLRNCLKVFFKVTD